MTVNRLPFVQHLALYTSFHQARRNRVVHQLAAPFVYGSALLALQVLVPALVLPLIVASAAVLALADWKGATFFGVQLLVEWAAVAWLSHQLPGLAALALAAVAQGGAWAALIFLGHQVFEPHLEVDGAPASKGLYFERHYNLAMELGVPVSLYDRVLQFSIAPLAHTNELLFALGLRRELEQQIAAARVTVVARLGAGLTPFGAEARETNCQSAALAESV